MWTLPPLPELLGLSVISGLVSVTLTRSQITAPLRDRLIGAPLMVGELVSCPFCMAWWTGVFFNSFLPAPDFLGFLLNGCLVIGISVVYMGLIMRLLYTEEAEINELRELLAKSRALLRNVIVGPINEPHDH